MSKISLFKNIFLLAYKILQLNINNFSVYNEISVIIFVKLFNKYLNLLIKGK